jgi:DNA ligase (NAD+)
LARFIHALGIRHVGEETSVDLAQYFGSIEGIKKASEDDIRNIPDIGGVVAREIYNWFRDSRNLSFVKDLFGKGIKIEKPEHVGAKLKGKTFVFTGTFEKLTRQEAERKVRMLGGDPSGSVSSQTDYVVVGENPGSKYDKAKELGVKTISEKEFLKMI